MAITLRELDGLSYEEIAAIMRFGDTHASIFVTLPGNSSAAVAHEQYFFYGHYITIIDRWRSFIDARVQ